MTVWWWRTGHGIPVPREGCLLQFQSRLPITQARMTILDWIWGTGTHWSYAETRYPDGRSYRSFFKREAA